MAISRPQALRSHTPINQTASGDQAVSASQTASRTLAKVIRV
ncbi:MAG: hypothetical protein AB1424_05345 [Thermodesulfobacteriota bacterium]